MVKGIIIKGGRWKNEPRNMKGINMMPKLGTRSEMLTTQWALTLVR